MLVIIIVAVAAAAAATAAIVGVVTVAPSRGATRGVELAVFENLFDITPEGRL